MSFVICYTDPETRVLSQASWYAPATKPLFPGCPAHETIIHLLQADGHELDVIERRFKNLPTAYAICTWRGEMAQFIYDNL